MVWQQVPALGSWVCVASNVNKRQSELEVGIGCELSKLASWGILPPSKPHLRPAPPTKQYHQFRTKSPNTQANKRHFLFKPPYVGDFLYIKIHGISRGGRHSSVGSPHLALSVLESPGFHPSHYMSQAWCHIPALGQRHKEKFKIILDHVVSVRVSFGQLDLS